MRPSLCQEQVTVLGGLQYDFDSGLKKDEKSEGGAIGAACRHPGSSRWMHWPSEAEEKPFAHLVSQAKQFETQMINNDIMVPNYL